MLGLGRVGLAVLAAAAFAYMAWNPIRPPPIDPVGDDVGKADAAATEVPRMKTQDSDAAVENINRAFAPPESWALATARSGAFDDLSRSIAGAVNGDAGAGSFRWSSATVGGSAAATCMVRSRGPPVEAMS
jgi:hypothetical protein